MINSNKFTIYLTLFKLQKYLYLLVHNFPKEYKYTLGQSILDVGWETLDNIISAKFMQNKYKTEKIQKASESFDKLKTRLRMSYELKIISQSKYSHLIRENERIGREINGWLVWSKKQA